MLCDERCRARARQRVMLACVTTDIGTLHRSYFLIYENSTSSRMCVCVCINSCVSLRRQRSTVCARAHALSVVLMWSIVKLLFRFSSRHTWNFTAGRKIGSYNPIRCNRYIFFHAQLRIRLFSNVDCSHTKSRTPKGKRTWTRSLRVIRELSSTLDEPRRSQNTLIKSQRRLAISFRRDRRIRRRMVNGMSPCSEINSADGLFISIAVFPNSIP